MTLASKLVRGIYPRGTIRRVLRGPLRGAKFIVVPGMGLTYAIGAQAMHFRFFSEQVRPGDTIFDIGANCGQMALLFSRLAGTAGKVVAFEPLPMNLENLRINLGLNGCENVQVVGSAAGNTDNNVSFAFDPACLTMGSFEATLINQPAERVTVEVPCVKLDTVMRSTSLAPNLLKIDVEGAGLEVVQGARELLATCGPKIYFEIHAFSHACHEVQALEVLQEEFGYELYELSGARIERPGPRWGDAVWCLPPDATPRGKLSC